MHRHTGTAPPGAGRSWRAWAALLALVGLLAAAGATASSGGQTASAAAAGSVAASRGGATGASEKVDEEVLADLAAGNGKATFWVLLAEQADLSAAAGIRNRAEQGAYVYERLTRTAERSQAALRAFLRGRNADFRPFWVVNAIRVTGDLQLLTALAARPDVEQIFAEKDYELPEPAPAADAPRIGAIEWGIDRINAPAVWAQGVTGSGIVVASIDTGVQFNHPALVGQYRGSQGGGGFDHNYNWHDPSSVCGSPTSAPCDNHGHGTHVTGTMVGDDGGANQIGVAPGARWIAAKGCETNSCSTTALLSSGQWILAPTDLNGANPNPALRPHVVNNSWGGEASSDPWYRPTVQAWVAAGIFPQFSNGNEGPGCGTAGNPGNAPESYSAGAFDINNVIASFSSRGPSAFGSIVKPNVAAPGVAIRSSVPTNGYASSSGTSMASPHVAGAVALLWAGDPGLVGNVAQTRSLLDASAIDVSNLMCGGAPGNNNVWGEGRLDVLAAFDAPSAPTLTLLPGSGPPGTRVILVGSDFPPGREVSVTFGGFEVATARTTLAGTLLGKMRVPTETAPGTYVVGADAGEAVGSATFVVTTG